ncbi:VTT domain-containing protein [Saccharopolyspora sp. K220]|uniref:DedA family protein n=1 Tax=Saccharopolyspora soli TaxID=2926618 RepID=UPI001F5763C5|nr:VTT domain-containing protein [Saccharopolyspora soli]MCI2419408.1 VTT domain-containing protein [Saccharopolyspora soli]
MDLINQIDISIREFISWAATLNPWLCVLLALGLLSLETSLFIGLLIPGEATLLMLAAVLGPRWAPALFVAAVLGNLIGQTGGYWLGRLIGPRLRNTWAGRKIGTRRWQAAEAIVHDTGARALITTRFIAVVHAVVPAVVGTLRLPFRRFLGLAAIGATLWAAVLTALAVALGEAARVVGYGWAALGLTCAGGAVAIGTVIRSARRQSGQQAPKDPPVAVESRSGHREN